MAYISGTATDYIDLLDQLEQFVTSDHVDSVVINAGGTGYVIGDILTVAGGTATHVATLKVTSVAAGVIDGIKIEEGGAYTADPTLTANAVTGGTGSGATMDLTMALAQWVTERAAVYSGSEQELILRGEGEGGTDEIYVGARTFQDGGVSAFNWELAGFTGFDSGLDWQDQPGISPGRFDDADPVTEGGQFVLLDNASIDFWFFANGRRIIMVAKIASTYESMYLGFVDTYATDTEAPYPLLIAGSCAQKGTRFNSTRGCHSGISDPRSKELTASTQSAAAMVFRLSDGFWYSVENSKESSGVATSALELLETNILAPTGGINIGFGTSTVDNNGLDRTQNYLWDDFKHPLGTSPTFQIRATPGSPNLIPFFPLVITLQDPSTQIPGEISNVFWFTKAGSTVADEDLFVIGDEEYLIFHNCNQTNDWDYFCVKKE